MTTPKTTSKEIDKHIAGFPKDVQVILEKIRKTIRKAAPNAQETINYGIPTFTLEGNLVHFAGFKNHVGFYPTPSGIEKFKKNYLFTRAPKARSNFRWMNPFRMN